MIDLEPRMTSPNVQRLAGQTVLVTGGAGGIGEAQVRAALQHGATAVVIADVDGERGRVLAADLGSQAMFVHLDVASEKAWAEALQVARGFTGRPVDVLMHTAGVIRAGLLDEVSADHFRAMLEVNLTGLFLGLKSVAQGMEEAGGGAVVAISSIDAFAAVPTFGVYAAAKAGVLALVRAAAIEFAPRRIRVNAIAPGAIDTPMTRAAEEGQEVLADLAKQVPWGRVGTPSDVANASVFLASKEADFITGSTLVVDGGSMARISLSLDGWYMPPQRVRQTGDVRPDG